jgi:hypothetical protein
MRRAAPVGAVEYTAELLLRRLLFMGLPLAAVGWTTCVVLRQNGRSGGLARTASALRAALVAVALGSSGCSGGGDCQGSYDCPVLLLGQVAFPADSGVTLTSMTTAAPCRVIPTDGGVWLVSFNATIAAGITKTCKVQGRLSDGTDVEADVPFQSLHCCGNSAINGGDTVTLSRVSSADASSQ